LPTYNLTTAFYSAQITSGLNAIAHAVEALWAPEKNPIISNLAIQGIEAIGKSLPLIHKDANDREGRSNALFGAWACGTCLGAVGMSLHHKLVSPKDKDGVEVKLLPRLKC